MNAPADYRAFVEAKIKLASFDGIEVDPAEVNPRLKPHQRVMVLWALKGGRRALFAAFGLGKTVVQIEILRLLKKHVGGDMLVVLPLGVRGEFADDAAEFFTGEHAVSLKFIRRPAEIDPAVTIHLANYETVRDGKLDPSLFVAASLDEAAILRSFGSETYQTFLPLFAAVRFRFVATATPSPNRFKELIHYAGFLGVMDTGQALTRFFQRDSSKAGNLTLYPHKEDEFWLWVHSWALLLQRPSDLGFSDEGYDLPELIVRWHEVPSDHTAAGQDRDGQALMFRNAALGLGQAASEKRDSIGSRIGRLLEITAADPDSHRIVWHDLEDERRAIEKALPRAKSVFGAQDLDTRETLITGFKHGRYQYLAAKPVMLGAGCNFQRHCHKATFLGVGHKFHDFIQAIRRLLRFGQAHAVEIDIIHTEAEREIVRDLQAKWVRDEEMRATMSGIIRRYGLNHAEMAGALTRTIGVTRIEVAGERFAIANNDCVDEARRQPDASVDLIVTSIPFANHYEYTPSYEDFGHTDDNAHFWAQMDFLTPELLRILKPGRLACLHVKDRVQFGNVTGAGVPTISPFHAETIFHGRRHGFDYLGLITIVTDVVRENNQTYRLGWTENGKDSSKMGVGSPEYLVLLRKPQSNRTKAYADEPVTKAKPDYENPDGTIGPFDPKAKGQKPLPGTGYSRSRWQIDAHAFWRSSGNRMITPDEMAQLGPAKLAKVFSEGSMSSVYDYEHHVRVGEELDYRGALPATFMSLAPGAWPSSGVAGEVWHDINRMLTLNGNQAQRNVEQHLCPLQFDIVDRCIERYSNPGELIYDPFGGLMTVPYRAILKGRRARASELSPTYFLDGVHYCRAAEEKVSVPTLFDLPDSEAA